MKLLTMTAPNEAINMKVVFIFLTAAKTLLGMACCLNRIQLLSRYKAEFVVLAAWSESRGVSTLVVRLVSQFGFHHFYFHFASRGYTSHGTSFYLLF